MQTVSRDAKNDAGRIVRRDGSHVQYADGSWGSRPLTKLEMSIAEALRVCPFCGGGATVTPWHGGGPRRVLIECDIDNDCDVSPSVSGDDIRIAAERWNRRSA